MTKKHFVGLADAIRMLRPVDADVIRRSGAPDYDLDHHIGRIYQWRQMRDALADFCAGQNPRFDRERWLAYVAGEPNGGRGGAA